MAPLPWLPSSLLKETADWGFASTVQSSMGSLLKQGQELMQPVREQVTEVVRQALPQPATPAPVQPAMPEVRPFTLPSLESWGMHAPEPPRPPQQPINVGPTPQATPGPPERSRMGQSASAGFLGAGGFSLPSLESWGIGSGARPGTPTPATGGMGAPPASGPAAPTARPSSPTGPPRAPGEIEAYIRQSAAARGIDPDTAMKVVMAEGGVTDPVRQSDVVYQGRRETSYGPLQLNTAGGVGSAALKAGIDPRDPAQWRQAVDFGLDEVARSGWGQWHGAARVGVGPRQGIGGPRAPAAQPAQAQPSTPGAPRPGTYAPEALGPSPATTGPAGVPTAVAEGAGWRETWGKDLTPNQINETLNLGLSWDAAMATCGVAAAVAFGRANGRAPTFKEALELAQRTGEWNADVGMTRGTSGQIALLKGLGVDASARPLAEAEVAQAVSAGQPVQINAHGSGGHFYVAQDYDPQTRKFNFGNSAAILKRSGGQTWYRLDELPSLGVGTPSEAIYLAGRR